MQLTDEVAEEVMREAARAKLERCLGTALQNVKTRTKKSDFAPAVQVPPYPIFFIHTLETALRDCMTQM